MAALERGLDADPNAVADAEAAPDLESLADRIDALEERVTDLEAGLQAVRGYVGGIDHVNETVERRANAALAAVERLEAAPKTPPPIATAEREQPPDPPERDSSLESDAENQSAGVVDRLKALR